MSIGEEGLVARVIWIALKDLQEKPKSLWATSDEMDFLFDENLAVLLKGCGVRDPRGFMTDVVGRLEGNG